MIRARLLGPIDITVDGAAAPPELLWRKHLGLLIYLALSPGRSRPRDHLIALLWSEKTEDAARHSLNEAIRILRRLSDDGVERQQLRVQLDDDVIALDTTEFESAVAAHDYEAAARLVVGEFMEGFSVPDAWEFEEWLSAQRRHWREQSLAVLSRYAHELLARGDLRTALRTSERALALDPAHEEAVRARLVALVLLGERAAALRFYDEFARRLADDLGVSPNAETEALAERIRRERVWLHKGDVVPVTTRRAPLTGVSSELSTLAELWFACAREKRCGLAIIQGDTGTGKTRLLEEVAVRARLDGASVISARAVQQDRQRSWSGASGLLRALDAAREGEEPSAEQLRDALLRSSHEQPTLVGIDDADWLDAETLNTIPFLLRDVAREPVLIVLTAQIAGNHEQLELLRSRIGRDYSGVTVRLHPFGSDALRQLVRWSLPDYDDTQIERVSRRIAADSAGVPFLVVELLHAIANGLEFGPTRSAWPEPSHTLDQTLPGDLPDAVVAAIRVGFRKLSTEAQQVLIAASVLGTRVTPETLRTCTSLDPKALDRALDELEWQRWLAADARGYSFVARIALEVVARDMVTDGQRARILTAASSKPMPVPT